ncbi:MAG TPA: hypothetical protein VIN60_03785, partial [Anaerolineales bacterium]
MRQIRASSGKKFSNRETDQDQGKTFGNSQNAIPVEACCVRAIKVQIGAKIRHGERQPDEIENKNCDEHYGEFNVRGSLRSESQDNRLR